MWLKGGGRSTVGTAGMELERKVRVRATTAMTTFCDDILAKSKLKE